MFTAHTAEHAGLGDLGRVRVVSLAHLFCTRRREEIGSRIVAATPAFASGGAGSIAMPTGSGGCDAVCSGGEVPAAPGSIEHGGAADREGCSCCQSCQWLGMRL